MTCRSVENLDLKALVADESSFSDDGMGDEKSMDEASEPESQIER
jgi:hypothetical protein